MSRRRELQGLEKVARRGQCRLVSEPEPRYEEEIVARVSDHQQIAELGHRRDVDDHPVGYEPGARQQFRHAR